MDPRDHLRALPDGLARTVSDDPVPADPIRPLGPAAAVHPPSLDSRGRPWPTFAHASEAEMARILDFYAVSWDYEPSTFPILWNLDGDVIESFSPDFHLPELDLWLEMTTLKQRLVRKKNRKLRRLRELYPSIRIKLFYARDFRAMMLKYGRLALADSLSGTLGQIAPDRASKGLESVAAALRIGSVAVLPGPLPRRRRARRSAVGERSLPSDPPILATVDGRTAGSRETIHSR